MSDFRPWKVMVDGFCYKDYKRKWAALRWANILKDSFQKKVCIDVVSPLEVINVCGK